MNTSVSWKWAWAFFSLLLLTTLQQNHAESESITKPFHNRVFQWKKKYQTETQEQGLTLDLKTILAGALSFAGASISSAGGLGGGGLFVPILNLVAGLDLKTATAVSAFMVTGGSLANAIYCFSAKIPGSKHKPLVDYDIALLSEPCMLLGVSLGVICNVMCPEWLISTLLAIFLACSTFLTCRAGFRCWRTETSIAVALEIERRERGNGFSNLIEDIQKEGCSGIDEVVESMQVPLLEKKTEESFGFFPWRKLGILVLIWVCFFLLHVLQGGHGRKSLIPIEPCSIGYWLLSAIQIPLALGFTAWILKQKDWYESYHTEQPKVTVVGEGKEGWARLVFPVVALLSGILGGLFGIGGGMLINPILLQISVPPQITAATSSFMVLFSSSMSAVQYLLLGMKRLDYAILFSVICFSSSLIGLALIQTAIARYGRASLIVFSVGTVMALSAILVTSFGALDVWRDYTTGQYMGFRLPC